MATALLFLCVILIFLFIAWVIRGERDICRVDGGTHTPETEADVMRRYNHEAIKALNQGKLLALEAVSVSGGGMAYSFYMQCAKCHKNLYPYMGSVGE